MRRTRAFRQNEKPCTTTPGRFPSARAIFSPPRYFLEDPRLKKLGELSKPYEADTRDFLRRPTTLAPKHPGTLPFLRGLYDELLPNFSSHYFNVGCDETWDLGKGQSKKLCEANLQGRYVLEVIDLYQQPQLAQGEQIIAVPALIKRLPEPLRMVIGDMSDTERVLVGLDLLPK